MISVEKCSNIFDIRINQGLVELADDEWVKLWGLARSWPACYLKNGSQNGCPGNGLWLTGLNRSVRSRSN